MSKWKQFALLLALLSAASAGGCRDAFPHSFTWAPGDIVPTHAKPAEGGYYTNWDPYAAGVEVVPVDATNPTLTQHVLIATVKDKDGKPLPNRRVEWIIAAGSVGSIVEVDESGLRASRGHKLTNRYAVSHTNNFDHVLTRGNDDPADDVHLKKGQTWCVITSPMEGDTHMIVYVPAIHNWDHHKVFVRKHWYDVRCVWPAAASNPMGTPHQLTTKVMRHSDGSPLAGYAVHYQVAAGPAAVFEPGDKDEAHVLTDEAGMATVTLKQASPAAGTNDIHIEVIRPENKQCCLPAKLVAQGATKKTWISPQIRISKAAPTEAVVGANFDYTIVVHNPSDVDAEDVVVTDALPEGISHVSSSPPVEVKGQALSWSVGTLATRGQRKFTVTVKAGRTGTFHNCAAVTAAYGLSAEDCADTLVMAPKLLLEKDAPAEALICEMIPYTLMVRNNGDAPATNVKVADDLPDGLMSEDGRKSVAFEIGTLLAGESKQLEFKAKADETGTYTNTATATGDGGLTAEASARTVVRRPVLAMTKTGPKMRFVGRPVTYTITITNKGDAAATNTVLTDTVPAGTSFVEASDGGRFADGKVTWELGTLAVDATKTVTLTLKADSRGTVRNMASVTAVCSSASAEASTDVKGIPAILLELIDLEDPIEVGARETYVITITNQGSADDTNIALTCTLPDEEDYVSADGPTKGKLDEKVLTFEPLRTLEPKDKAVYRVVVKGTKAGDVRFKIRLTSDQMTSPVEESESTRIYSE